MRIAVLIGGIAYEVQKRLLEGIMKYARKRRITIDVFTCNGDMYGQSEYGAGEFQIYNLPELKRYDGVIFAKDTIQNEQCADEIAEKIRKAEIPAVSNTGCQQYRESRKKDLAEVQLKNARQRLATVSLAENNKNMASDLNDCDNFEDFCECLKNYISALDFSFVYLTLCEEVLSEDKTEYDYRIREDYSEKVYIPIAYEKGNFTKYPCFDRKELLPEKCREKLVDFVERKRADKENHVLSGQQGG